MTWTRRLPLAAAVAVTLALAACSAPSAERREVLPIDDILTTEVVITPDATGTSAVLTVETTIPVACSVVYGVDDSFGLIATDEDMAGGAHHDHQPRLRGLTPGTTYRYRLQGSDAAGNLYRSQTMTFTTPDAATQRAPGENVAARATIAGFSSEFSERFAATNAIDGDPATEWSSDSDGDDAFITLDLGRPEPIVGIGFWSREMGDGSAIIEQYTVTVDGGNTLGPFPAGPGLTISDVAFTGQVLRFDATTTTGGNTGAAEIEIYREP